jgi:hypothetical protein
MPNIIAAQFDDFPRAEGVLHELTASGGIASSDVDQVVLGAPGRHDRFPLGGDVDADAGAAEGDHGARAGAAIGGAAGAATGLILGPVGVATGAALGAYGGSLAGALGGMGTEATDEAPPPRPAGVMVMVHVQTWRDRALALNAFQKYGARSIEEAEGQWTHGTWADFNPVATPHWLVPPSTTPSTPIDDRSDGADA